MTSEQIKIISKFFGNEHVKARLLHKLQNAMNDQQSQLIAFCSLVDLGHQQGLDWYITGGANNTVRCGRKSINNLRAEDRLIRIQFFQGNITVSWRGANENTNWGNAERLSVNLPLEPANLTSLQNCITYLAVAHRVQPRREGFWPYHYNKREIDRQFENEIEELLNLDINVLLQRANQAPEYPSSHSTETIVYNRNAAVVAAARLRANGKCENCNQDAPFLRRSDNRPYLEVHHKTPLAQGGKDRLENVVALCPNCHRKMHFGPLAQQ